ncbi:MAG: alpha/beta hydrolase [Pseudomonadales bacterium]|nr:alpha/beta hydrolase [Pseudomonadales bacterium]
MFRELLSISLIAISTLTCAQEITTTRHQVYGQKDGMAMYYDVVSPESPNGLGIVYIVSGGFLSGEDNLNITEPFWNVLLENGYTMFQIYHPAHPTYRLPDMFDALKLGVIHIKENSHHFGVDNQRLGVFGVSSGGHLALLMGLSVAPEDRSETDFKAIVAMMPLVDATDPVFDDELFGARHSDYDPALYPVVSPVTYVTPDDPPTMLIHGIHDRAVDFEQNSVRMQNLLNAAGVVNRVVPVEAGHEVFPEPMLSEAHTELLNWFNENL